MTLPGITSSLLPLTTTLAVLLATYIFYRLFLYTPFFSPLRHIPGPPKEHVVYGNMPSIVREPPGLLHTQWSEKYGGVVKYTGVFGEDRLLFTDPVALNHILNHAYEFPKPPEVRGELARILGKGILFAEGDDHKRQKKVMNPAFSPSHLRDIAPTFFECTYKLRDKFHELIDSSTTDPTCFASDASLAAYQSSKPDGEIVLNVSTWLSRVTLDVIGQAGFGYSFGAVEGQTTKLAEAFQKMFAAGGTRKPLSPFMITIGRGLGKLMAVVPFDIAGWLPIDRLKRLKAGLEALEEESRKIVQERKKVVEAEGDESLTSSKDLMSLLLRSNMSGDPKTMLTDAELQGQMTTMLLAGHETSGTSLTWLLWRLSLNPKVQHRLRAEIRVARRAAIQAGREEISSDELEGLEYLDAVVREILRLESPAPATIRTSIKDECVPLGTPVTSPNGETLTSIVVPAGSVLFLSIAAVNKSKKTWGEDAEQFRPERWLEGKVEGGVGVYSHILTFLAGPRACIGYKFALLEIKTILAVLIDDFAFSEREPGLEIERRSALVMRSLVKGEEHLGFRMPLRISFASKDE